MNNISSVYSKKIVVCIPARYASTRFPGKPLAELDGKPIIQWTYDRACRTIADKVVVATDDKRIMETVEGFGGNCVMTSTEHFSGTDRVWEAVRREDAGIIINIQGDEPLVNIDTVNNLILSMKENPENEIGTVAVRIKRETIGKDPNAVKVVINNEGYALYFSRSEIPYDRTGDSLSRLYLHLGIYAYRYDILKKFISLEPGILEGCEKLEQLRALENGINIYTIIADGYNGIGIDTPEDLSNAEQFIKKMNY
ncbi:MAG: 3-deoxy-manno-octulosonate cytidylyltransferase [Victivallales bacterium]|nr:3-deoxy-manno-octulosonate cytidylyltransferase [Victivallales bacterium]